MIVTIALKKIPTGGVTDKIVAKMIKWWTKSKYFHVEMIIKDKWISTNPEAGAVYIRDLAPLKSNYDYFDIEVDGRKVLKTLKFLEEQVGKKYDYWGILFSTVIKANVDDRDKWFCSEIVSEALKYLGNEIPKNSNQMTPGDVHNFIKNIEYK